MSKQAIGVVGLAVMGRNLALNIESRGHAVSVFNRSREKTDELIAEYPDRKLVPAFTLEEFVESLEKPRRILLMVKAGEGTDATIFTHGTVVAQALQAAEELALEGHSVRVVDMFTLKPIDEELIVRCAAETGGRFVVLEDHLAYGGLASRLADVIADRGVHLTAFERLGIPQVYAGFGEDEELRDKYGYGLAATIAATRRVMAAQP